MMMTLSKGATAVLLTNPAIRPENRVAVFVVSLRKLFWRFKVSLAMTLIISGFAEIPKGNCSQELMEPEAAISPQEKDKIHKLVVLVGDQGSEHYKRDLTKFSGFLLTHLNAQSAGPLGSSIRAYLLKKLTTSIRLLTSKGKVYACVAFMLMANNVQRQFVENLIDSVYAQFIQDIRENNFNCIKNALLFFAECTNLEVLHIFTFLNLLNILLRQAEKAQKIVKEELTFAILSVLPFLADFPLDNCEMEFKNALEDVDKLYRSCTFTLPHVVAQFSTKQAPNMLSTFYDFYRQAMTNKKAVDFMNVGYKDLIPESRSVKSIRKSFEFNPEDSKLNLGAIVFKRSLNFFFLDLFAEQYNQAGLPGPDRHIAALFIYEVIMTTRLNITIIGEKLTKHNFRTSERTKNYLIAEIIVAEVIKTFQTQGILVFLVSLSAYLFEHRLEGGDEFKMKMQAALDKLALQVNDLSLAGLENLGSWFAHLRINTGVSMSWLKDLRTTDKGKFLINRVLRNIIQLSSYSRLHEGTGMADLLDFFPPEPRAICSLSDPGHPRNTDYRLLVEKFGQEMSSDLMRKYLYSNELSCFGKELEEVFLITLLDKSQTSFSDIKVMFETYERVLRDFFKTGEEPIVETLKTIENFWANSPQHVVYIFEMLVKKEFVHIQTMANYLIEKLTSKTTTLEKNAVAI